MKKFTLFLSALLISMVSMAASIDFSAQGYTNAQVIESATIEEGLVVTFDKANGSTAPTYYNTGTAVRVYGGATMTVTATGKTISKIVLTYGTGDKTNAITANCGTFETDTWTGSASSVTFTVDGTSGHRRIKVVEVTLGEGGTTPEDPETPTEPEDPETPTEPEQPEQPEGVLTCAEAVAICQETGETATTESYTVRGYVTVLQEAYNSQFGNATFYIADTKDGGKVLLSYRVKPENDAAKAVKVGDYVEVIGTLVNYKGNTPEVSTGGKYTIVIAAEGGDTPVEPEIPEVETVGDGTEANPFTVEDVIALNNTLSGKHYVRAYIVGHANGASFADGLDLEAPFEGSTNTDGSVATQGTNLAIASTLTPDIANIIPVQLPKNNLRNDFNLVEHPEMLGKQVLICGELVKYFSLTGIKNPTSIVLVNTTETAVDNVTVNQNITKFFENGQLIIIKDGVKFNAQGQVVK